MYHLRTSDQPVAAEIGAWFMVHGSWFVVRGLWFDVLFPTHNLYTPDPTDLVRHVPRQLEHRQIHRYQYEADDETQHHDHQGLKKSI